MTKLYTGQEYQKEFKTKKTMLIVWLVMLGVYLGLSLFILFVFIDMPYGTRWEPFIISNIALSTLFWGFTLFFHSTKYFRLKRYVKMLGFLQSGIKESYIGQFLRFDDDIEVKEGVEFYKMITKEWNEKKQEYFERKVLIDREIDKPQIPEGSRVKYVTQGNILIKYAVLGEGQVKDK